MKRSRVNYSVAQRSGIWDRWQAGEPTSSIGRRFPPDRHRAQKALSPSEREEISRWLILRRSLWSIARHLGRSPSTISREVRRNRGADRYRAAGSDQAAWDRARRSKLCKLAAILEADSISSAAAAMVTAAYCRLAQTHISDGPSKQVSDETIYRSLFIQARGVLKKELLEHLRAKRTVRRSRHASMKRSGPGQIKNAVSIRERPPSVEDRAVPGHREGDLDQTPVRIILFLNYLIGPDAVSSRFGSGGTLGRKLKLTPLWWS